jgi:multicomponent Na+:H+ antiporter subunit B
MISLILRTATRYLITLLLLFSIFLLLSGHNAPGGGFVGGLVAAAAFILYSIAYDVAAARRTLRVEPRQLIGGGLLAAGGSGVFSLLKGQPYLTGHWAALAPPATGTLTLGTPLLFDAGVYLVVVGVTLLIIFSLAEE